MQRYRTRVQRSSRALRICSKKLVGCAAILLAALTFASTAWAQTGLLPVYRFYNLSDGRHFYTISTIERDFVIANYPRFIFEGPVFSAYAQQVPGTVGVTRFFNVQTGEHFWTALPNEVAYVLANYPQYVLEGVVYYVPLVAGSDGRTDLYRFWNPVTAEHFFTASTVERDYVLANYPQFIYEGTVYYVYDPVSGGTAPPGGPPPNTLAVALAVSNSTVTAPAQVILTANASDGTGTIVMVSLYQNGTKLVELTTPPYTYTVTLSNSGDYSFTAVAIDNLGATAQSTVASVHVNPAAPPPPAGGPTDIYRLLNQATFGFTQAEATRVSNMGMSAWIDDQFAQPISGYPDTNYTILQLTTSATCTNTDPTTHVGLPANDPRNICYRDNLTPAGVQRNFFTNAVSAPDQLRQRVAWALSQITVISTVDRDLAIAYPMTRYQNILFNNAFGNFETLLNQITLSPSMGYWLTMVNNDKGTATRQPNQNYAREIMQLFSIGLVQLDQGGNPILDASGNEIPTYDQNTIAQLSNVFTGWTYPLPGATQPTATKNPANYTIPMMTYLNGHDTTQKTLLPGPNQVLPANETPQQDITAAIHNIFMHPNVGPFIGRQLIQHLVTSNPSSAYVSRVAAVFNDDGTGVRGNMQAVVKAILMDPEARGAAPPDTFGQLREPVLMVTAYLRGLGIRTDGAGLSARTSPLGQPVYSSPTVFNYYPIDYTIPNTSLDGPEFGNHNSFTAVGRTNTVYSLVYAGIAVDPTVPNAVGTIFDTTPWQGMAGTPATLVAALNHALMNDTLPADAAQIIVNSISQVPSATQANLIERVRMAVYQMVSSFHFQVQH